MVQTYLKRLPRFEYLAPRTVGEACSLLERYQGKARPLAGGTDLLVEMKLRRVVPSHLIGLKGIPGLDAISFHPREGLRLGAMATHRAIMDSPVVRKNYPLLALACSHAGPPQVRNMGTLGGNLCNGGPSQDTPPALLALDARLRLVSSRGERVIPIDKFFQGPFRTALEERELLVEVVIPPLTPGSAWGYQRLSKRTLRDEALVGVSVLLVASPDGVCQEARIGLCSVAPVPMRARRAEACLKGADISAPKLIEQAARVAGEEVSPRSRAEYRRAMTSLLVKRALEEAQARLSGISPGLP